VRAVASVGASLLTVHASGGEKMMRAAAEAAASCANGPRLLAVTVLTSMSDAELAALGVGPTGLGTSLASEQAGRLAKLAKRSGIDGFVCSAMETRMLRGVMGAEGLLVVPGIRPAGEDAADQSRIATPGEAVAAGASMLVVGRPITRAADPQKAAAAILAEIAAADHGL
jgi:orotidine-5'-phosphate decarboxylase